MNTADLQTKLIDSYISLLKNMKAQTKLELISKLKKTVETDTKNDNSDFYKAFGGWDENESAEELIESIKNSRTFKELLKRFNL